MNDTPMRKPDSNLPGTLALLALVVLPWCWGTGPEVRAEDELLFYCPFDGTVTPSVQKGETGAETSGPVEFVAGLKGQAFVTAHNRSVRFPLRGNLGLEEGAIVFWVMPMDWTGADQQFHHFLTVPDNGTAPKGRRVFSLILYRFVDWESVVAFGMNNELTGEGMLQIPMDATWKPGVWHMIGFTWGRRSLHLYVDGTAKGKWWSQEPVDTFGADRFSVGGPYFAANETRTAVDELKIYRRRLTTVEVKSLYASQAGTAADH